MTLRVEILYFINYLDPVKKKWLRTRWKMTESAAAERFKGTEWNVYEPSREERTVGWGVHDNTPGAFRNHPKKRNSDE